ncbi:MAG: DUF3833 domain-containing protein [Desulforhopalus sp.]
MKTLAVILGLALSSCSGVDVNMYQGKSPQFDLYTYFQGETRGWGIVQDRKGMVTRQFVVDIEGTVDDQGQLILKEDFDWSDGEQSNRTWTISRTPDGGFIGRAGDVVGNAVGKSTGNALQWTYTLLVEVDGKNWEVAFDDWMFLQPDQVVINRTEMSKFGLKVGDVTMVFRKGNRLGEGS